MSVPLMAEFQEFASPVVPDRADQPVSETTERFLRAIVDRIPIDRIEELHLFSPLRQGTVETGIAVVAGVVLVPDVEVAPTVEQAEREPLELSLDAGSDEAVVSDEVVDDAVVDAAVIADAVGDAVEGDEVDPYATEAPYTDAVAAIDAAPVSQSEVASDDESDTEPGAAPDPGPDFGAMLNLDVATGEASEPIIAERTPVERHTVYTARYRLVIKGPDRGRWEADLVEEADAPLVTVETVVRGVQRRAGEDTEIVRYNAAQIARALRIPRD